MGITWKECLPAPSLGLPPALGPLPDTCGQEMAGWAVSRWRGLIQAGAPTRLGAHLHRQRRPCAAHHLIGVEGKHCLDPAAAHQSPPSLLLHATCLWVHFGLIRLLVLGPKLKSGQSQASPFLVCTYPIHTVL